MNSLNLLLNLDGRLWLLQRGNESDGTTRVTSENEYVSKPPQGKILV